MTDDFEWVFFDCFNTLIDDFHANGDESGLGSLPQIAVTRGFFDHPDGFITAYQQVRKAASIPGKETLLEERLQNTLRLSPATPDTAKIDETVGDMLQHWETEYRDLIRVTPGAKDILAYWSGRKQLGVISNFYLPAYPARYLRDFGLAYHFKFILDSATFGFKKPHRSIFEHALKLAGLKPTEANRVLMIGDRLDVDILPANEVGFQTLHFNRSQDRAGITATPPEIGRICHLAEFR